MDELEELKKKRLEQLRQAYANQSQPSERQQETEAAQQFEVIEDAVKAHLTKEALQRYGAVKLAHKETAMQLVLGIAHAIQEGRLRGMLGEEQLVAVLKQLSQLSQSKRITKITRK